MSRICVGGHTVDEARDMLVLSIADLEDVNQETLTVLFFIQLLHARSLEDTKYASRINYREHSAR